MEQQNNPRTYLGDGLYCHYDGFQFNLIAPRENGEHFVALEPEVLMNFLKIVEKKCNVTIEITANEVEK